MHFQPSAEYKEINMGIAPDSIMGVTVQTVTDQMKEIDQWAQDYNKVGG